MLRSRKRRRRIPLPLGIVGSFEKEIDTGYLKNFLVNAEHQQSKVNVSLYSRPALHRAFSLPLGRRARHIWVVGSSLYVIADRSIYKYDSPSAPVAEVISDGGLIMGFVQTAVIGDSTLILINQNLWVLRGDSLQKLDSGVNGYEPSRALIGVRGFGIVLLEDGNTIVPTTNAYDPTAFNFADIADAEYKVDPSIALATFKTTALVFGEQSTEVWTLKSSLNDNESLPIARNFPGMVNDVGILHLRAFAKSVYGICYIGSDYRVYHFNGNQFEEITTLGVSRILKDVDVNSLYCTSFEYLNRYFYAISWDGKTLIYDTSTRAWSEFSTNGEEPWGIKDATIWGAESYLVRGDDGVYTLTKEEYKDNGEGFIKNQVTLPVLNSDDRVVSLSDARVDLAFSGGPEDTQFYMTVEYSTDGGYTWLNGGKRSFGSRGARGGTLYLGSVPASKDLAIRLSYDQDTSLSVLKVSATATEYS